MIWDEGFLERTRKEVRGSQLEDARTWSMNRLCFNYHGTSILVYSNDDNDDEHPCKA